MLYTECPFYGLQSKKVLKRLLRIQDSKFLKQDYCASLVYPHIVTDPKDRLIESPHVNLKILQSRIKTYLGKIHVDDNVFSGIKGRSYADNAKQHVGDARRNLFHNALPPLWLHTYCFTDLIKNSAYTVRYKPHEAHYKHLVYNVVEGKKKDK